MMPAPLRLVNRQPVSHTQLCMFTHDAAIDLLEFPDHFARVRNVLRSAVDGGVQGVDPQIMYSVANTSLN
jgi:hypothetical protein